jgi:hypothetical protein
MTPPAFLGGRPWSPGPGAPAWRGAPISTIRVASYIGSIAIAAALLSASAAAKPPEAAHAGAKRFIGIDVAKAQLDVAVGQTERAFSVAKDETEVAAGGFDNHQVNEGWDITFRSRTIPKTLGCQPLLFIVP